MKEIFNPSVLASPSYRAPDRKPGLIRLDSMEHPFNLSEKLKTAIKKSVDTTEFNRYPDSNLFELEYKIKQTFGIADNLALLFGNGSDELIAMLISATNSKRPVLSLAPSFSMYSLLGKMLGRDFIEVDLDSDFQIDLAATLKAIQTQKPSLIFLAEPNNPTGKSFSLESIEQICEAARQQPQALVVLDEAYYAFSKRVQSNNPSMLQFINDRFENVVVLRTLSKMGFASLRFGFMIGPKPLIDLIRPLRLPYNINGFNQALIDIALDFYPDILSEIKLICEFRDQMLAQIKAINEYQTYDSDTNFLLVKSKKMTSKALFDALLNYGISVKDLKNSHPYLKDHIRVSMGSAKENEQFIDALKRIAKSQLN